MPKKKKGGGKKDKPKQATKPSPEVVLNEPEMVPQNTKEFYLLQIQDLEERLGRYRRQCDLLKQHNEDLRESIHSNEQDMKGIISTISDENERLTCQVFCRNSLIPHYPMISIFRTCMFNNSTFDYLRLLGVTCRCEIPIRRIIIVRCLVCYYKIQLVRLKVLNINLLVLF